MHLLKESNIRNPGYFVFANTSMLLCVHGAEVFAKTKCPISALTAHIYQSIEQTL